MTRRSVLVIALLLAGACRQASPTGAVERPLLWAAEKNGTTVYLFGTMHAGIDPSRVPASVFAKLDGARAFAMETDIPEAELVAAMQRSSGTLHDELGPEYWHKLEATLSPAQAQAIDGMKPMVAATMLSLRGLPPTLAMDRAMRDRARDRGKPVVLLEPPADQLAMLDRHMNAKAVRMLLDDPKGSVEGSQQLLAAYLSGDEDRIAQVVARQRTDALTHGYTEAEYGEFVADLIDRRNAAWIPVIEKLHADGGGFVAVGALHLIGPTSVRALLAARGFAITREK